MPVAVLFVMAIASIGIYGIVLGGWSSGSTYSLLGGLRSSAQMISYEVAMGLALVAVFLYAGSMSTSEIVAAQDNLWFGLILLPSFVIYTISMVGETNRAPFDLPEAEGELVGGFHTEYSLAEVRAVLPRRVHQHGHRLGAGHHAVPRRLARAVLDRPRLGRRQRGLLAGAVVLRQGARSSSSSSSGCAARCRGCATTSSWRFGWKRLIPVSLVWIVAVATIRAISLDGGIDRQLPADRHRRPRRAASLVLFFVGDAEEDDARPRPASREPRAGGFPVPPMPAGGASAAPAAAADLRDRRTRPSPSSARSAATA